jgi:hypothetical protein
MPMTYTEKCDVLRIVARSNIAPKQIKIVVDCVQDAFVELGELEEEVRDLRKKAGCEMCVGDDGHALYGAVGKYYYGDDVTADCFCVNGRKMEENPFHHIKNIVECEIENDDPVLSVLCETLKDVLAKMEKRDKELKKPKTIEDFIAKREQGQAQP